MIDINFSVSPTVIESPPGGAISVKEGEEVNLQCEVSGNPVPNIVWSKQVLILG